MKYPNFSFEKKLWEKGFSAVAGVDEVGRGAFSGPVVAGCVIFKEGAQIPKGIIIDDSKKVRPRKREEAAKWIKDNALTWGIGEAPASLINRIGMGKATKVAFRRAISQAKKKFAFPIDFLLIDAFFIPYIPGLPTRRRKDKKGRYRKGAKGRQLAIVNGDAKSISIAAASIIAKVERDKFMLSLSKRSKLKKYGWGRNKGYGTREHQTAIKKYGQTPYHRKSFVETWLRHA